MTIPFGECSRFEFEIDGMRSVWFNRENNCFVRGSFAQQLNFGSVENIIIVRNASDLSIMMIKDAAHEFNIRGVLYEGVPGQGVLELWKRCLRR